MKTPLDYAIDQLQYASQDPHWAYRNAVVLVLEELQKLRLENQTMKEIQQDIIQEEIEKDAI